MATLLGRIGRMLGGRRPRPETRFRILGDGARDLRDWSAAAGHYRAHVAIDPQDFAIWVQLGHALKEAGDPVEAERAYRQASRLTPDDADLLLNIGHLMKAQKRPADAVEAYRASYAIDRNAAAARELASAALRPFLAGAGNEADAADDAPARFVGALDLVDRDGVSGWAFDPDAPDHPCEVELLVGATVIARCTTDIRRPDTGSAADAGFRVAVDWSGVAPGSDTVEVAARLARTGEALAGSPARLELAPPRRATAARAVIAKPLAFVPGEHAIFVAHAPTGMLKPHVASYLRQLAAEDIAVTLVVNAERPVLLDDATLALVAAAIVRDNEGYDFGAWAHALALLPALYGAERLFVCNDSVFGRDDASLAQAIARVRASDADLVGLTQSLERGWHMQSYFMALSARLIASYAFQLFVGEIGVVAGKDSVIDRYEVPLARRVHDAGFTVAAVFPVAEARNPTLFAWRELLDAGFPFVKLLLARGAFPHVDTRALRPALVKGGFDLRALDRAIRYGSDEPAPATGFPLLVKSAVAAEADRPVRPYKVAVFGPWNYDNGLGSASRGIIAALRRTGVRLNLHPIRMPFHVHRPLGPANDVIDFEGPADIAVVHLNPDSWHLLDDAQRAAIAAAGKRIGYWVWEMAELPPAWAREFGSVDRIWAPSRYCAQVFRDSGGAPVDVVPHAVPVETASPDPAARTRALADFGLTADARVILYVFDGSSYLLRKNPAALVRAFGASRLAERGWSLLLKTKHLNDRPAEGAALTALVAATPGALLADRAMADGDLRALIVAADIYASPHSSEGFGLTIAEAMAAGRLVVATDFGGPRDFLDEADGFPVAASPWTLDEDAGHYLKGNSWARVDEAALAEALVAAAKRVAAGDGSLGEAARARVAELLSYEAVAERIATSFEALLGAKPVLARPTDIAIDGRATAGIAVEDARFGDGLRVVVLDADLSLPERPAVEPDDWLVLAPAGARLHPLLEPIVRRHIAARPDVAIFYADDIALGEPTLNAQLRLKPAFDRTLFAAQDYVGGLLVLRGSALAALDGIDAAAGPLAITALVLRAIEEGLSVERIAEVLVMHPGVRPILSAVARRELIAASRGYDGYTVEPGRAPNSARLRPVFAGGEPAVTICVPTRRAMRGDGPGTCVEALLDSIAATDWPAGRLTVSVGDDIAGDPDWATRGWPFALRRIETPREPGTPFNYSAKMNRLWRAAETEIVVLMNDDVVATDAHWLRQLVGFAADGSVGGAGPRLLYPDCTIQHAGIVGGLFGTSAHAWLGRAAGAPTYQDWAVVQREWSMLTGAVFATRRQVLEQVGGFDEGFALEFNDVDLCLKIRALGLRLVYDPTAQLVHAERASRGDTPVPGEQLARFLARCGGWLADDPAFHPGLRRDRIDLTPAVPPNAWYL